MHSGYNDIWCEILQIIDKGFPEEGLNKLEYYAERFNEGKILYKRFSPQEQYGCRKGGVNHVIASLLAGAKVATGQSPEGSFNDFKKECKHAPEQIETIKS